MNHRKPNPKIILTGLLAIAANFAFAPIFAGAMPHWQPSADKTVASDDQPEHKPSPAHRYEKTTPHSTAAESPATPEQQAAPSEPSNEPSSREFDGYTTFAVNEAGSGNVLSGDSDARIFGALGGGGSGGASAPVGRKGHTHRPQSAPGAQTDSGRETPPTDENPNSTTKPQDQARNETDKPNQSPQPDNEPREEPKPVASVPEPSTLGLVFAGVCGLIAARRLG